MTHQGTAEPILMCEIIAARRFRVRSSQREKPNKSHKFQHGEREPSRAMMINELDSRVGILQEESPDVLWRNYTKINLAVTTRILEKSLFRLITQPDESAI